MKIIVSGSLGNISKPLAIELVQQRHQVTVISSNPEKQTDIEALGAKASIGSMNDVDFLIATFKGVDAVYCMIPPNFAEKNQLEYYRTLGKNYAKAIERSGVKCVVELSSHGAHLDKGTGFIVGSYNVEKILNELTNVSVTHIRPGYFYYNFFSYTKMIKAAGAISANYGGEDKLAMVSPIDIASAIAEELVTPATGNKVRYVVSDDRTCNDIATILGTAIDKPDLKWIILTNEKMQNGLEANGVPAHVAFNLVEMGTATHSGALREDYEKHKPVMGKIKLEDFAKEFANTYNR